VFSCFHATSQSEFMVFEYEQLIVSVIATLRPCWFKVIAAIVCLNFVGIVKRGFCKKPPVIWPILHGTTLYMGNYFKPPTYHHFIAIDHPLTISVQSPVKLCEITILQVHPTSNPS